MWRGEGRNPIVRKGLRVFEAREKNFKFQKGKIVILPGKIKYWKKEFGPG